MTIIMAAMAPTGSTPVLGSDVGVPNGVVPSGVVPDGVVPGGLVPGDGIPTNIHSNELAYNTVSY